MKERPLRTTVIGSYPFPGWLESACAHLADFGPDDRAELQDDAVIAAIHDQTAAGLDVITDGEQTRLDFNLSFYGFLEGIALEAQPPRRFGRPRTIREASTRSPASFARRAAWASSTSMSASSGWRRRAPSSRPAFPAPTR
jgi:methionine synthase II (cobalamin-independent)